MRLIKRIGAAFNTKAGAFVFWALGVTAFFLLQSASWAFGWIPNYYPLGEAFVPLAFTLIVIGGVASFVFLKLPQRVKDIKGLRIAHVIACVLTGALFVWTFFLAFNLDQGPGNFYWTLPRGLGYLRPYLGYIGFLVGVPFVFLFFLGMKKRWQAVIAVAVSAAVALAIVAPYISRAVQEDAFGLSAYPLVLDLGDGTYSVVFASNRPSTGYLFITVEGEEVELFNAVSGFMRVGRVHNFHVPQEMLNGNAFRVKAREVLPYGSYTVPFGAIVESDPFQFRGDAQGDELNVLMAADWHEMPDQLVAAAENFPQADLFIMLGDFATDYTEDKFIDYIIAAGARVTGSEIPAIFARGNHETRGPFAQHMQPGLGMPSLYFQVQRGNVLFTVIDQGEDHVATRLNEGEHVSSILGSRNLAHREEQIAWLAGLDAPDEDMLHFAVVHLPSIDQEEDTLRDYFFEQFERLGVDMQLSGHWHGSAAMFFEANYEHSRFTVPTPLLIVGGPRGGGYTGDLYVSMAQVRADGTLRLLGYNCSGVRALDETIALR